MTTHETRDSDAFDVLELEALAAYDALEEPYEPGEDFVERVLAQAEREAAASTANSQGELVRLSKGTRLGRFIAVAATLAALVGSGVAVATNESLRGRAWAERSVSELAPVPVALDEVADTDDEGDGATDGVDHFAPVSSPGPLPADLGARLDGYLADHGRNYGPAFRFHGVVMVARGGEVEVVARGTQHVGPDAPLNGTDSRFHLGSLSQQLLAVAIMRLVERGQLDLDTTVGEVLDDYDGPGQAVTVEQLLSHTAGMPNFTDDMAWLQVRQDAVGPLVLRSLFEDQPLEAAPGEAFAPSNAHYVVLGQMASAVTGKPLPDLLETEVFGPAGMKDSFFGEGNGHAAGVAQGQEFDEYEVLRPGAPVHRESMGAAGGIVSTANDLRRFDRALRDGRLLSNASTREMHRPRHENYALGWIVDETQGVPSATHPGGVDGMNHELLRLSDGTVIVVLANTEVVDARQVASDVAAMVYGEDPAPHVEYVEQASAARRLLLYTGRYALTDASRRAYEKVVDPERLDLLSDVRIYMTEGRLWFEVVGYGRKWMHIKGGDDFFFKDRAGGVAGFLGRDSSGAPEYLEIREGGARFILERVP